MNYWAREPFEAFIRDNHFEVIDPGPLQAPILAFKLTRNEKLEIVINTVGDDETDTSMQLNYSDAHRAGTVRINDDKVVLQSVNMTTVTLSGIGSRSAVSSHNYDTGKREVREEAKIHEVFAEFSTVGQSAFTIDWLENVTDFYIWPDGIIKKTESLQTLAFGREDDALTLVHKKNDFLSGRNALHLTVAGIEFYLCTSKHKKSDDQIKPGFILYRGTPDNNTRRKIRSVLSFSLGAYLVYLGRSTYTPEWKLTSFKAVTAYSIDKKVFELPTMPPTFLSSRGRNEIYHAQISRLVSGLYQNYDDLQFGSLNWAYWHALCAPLHIAAVHFGAAIEALQRRYVAVHAKDFPTKLISIKDKWTEFSGGINATIDALDIAPSARETMKLNVGLLNQVPRRAITDELLKRLGLVLSEDEIEAWKRRHDAAHGNDIDPEDYPGMIRDVKLLKVLFHRMLLKIVDGSDQYFDYASLDFPLRRLSDPVPSQD